MRHRHLLETKLNFAGSLATDYLELFTDLVANSPGFMRKATLFHQLDYKRRMAERRELPGHARLDATDDDADPLRGARLPQGLRIQRGAKLPDIGGNCGEFLLQICKKRWQLRAAVTNLPRVDNLDQGQILTAPERDRNSFLKGDIRQHFPPRSFDRISFTSMLRDRSEDAAKTFLTRATEPSKPAATASFSSEPGWTSRHKYRRFPACRRSCSSTPAGRRRSKPGTCLRWAFPKYRPGKLPLKCRFSW